MAQFHYEWYTVDVLTTAGKIGFEIKARSKENAIKQIEKEVAYTNSEKNLSQPWFKLKAPIMEVYWDTLTLDRIGYERLY